MLYLERSPPPPPPPSLTTFWCACAPEATHRHERILPNGHPQIVISLARDYLTDANHPTDPLQHSPAALFLRIYSHHQQTDAVGLSELTGILFHPGGTTPFFPENTQLFTNCETDLTTLWGRAAQNLRNDLREAPPPARKFDLLDFALRHRLSESHESKTKRRPSTIDYALTRLHQSPGTTTITALTRDIGVSPPPL